MLTAANFTANLATAARTAAANVSLDLAARAEWPAEERIAFNRELAAIIANHPASFSAQSVSTANYVLARVYTDAPADSSLDVFIDAALEEERKINPFDSQNIGSVGKYLLGAAVIVGVAYVVARYYRPAKT